MTDWPQHLDHLFAEWPYEFGEVSARLVQGGDGRELLQLRVEMGVLQMETRGRPDGTRPGDCDTMLDFLRKEAARVGAEFALDDRQCLEIDREFVQFFHRRIAWLAVRDFAQAVADADHTLALMDFCTDHSPDESWTEVHEQYRPFVLFHRTQAEALATLEQAEATAAIAVIDKGIEQIGELFTFDEVANELAGELAEELPSELAGELAGELEDNELIANLREMKNTIVEQYDVQPSLHEQLAEAVAAEQYELAARLRDQMRRRRRDG